MSMTTNPRFFTPPKRINDVLSKVDTIFQLFYVADETAAVTQQLIELLKTYPTGGKQIHDANIVATMLAYNIDALPTQNVDHMRRFSDRITLLPLAQPSA